MDRPSSPDMLTFDELREGNITRHQEWVVKKDSLMFRAVELAGEVGELLNAIKKLEREGDGGSSTATMDDVAEELGDVVICTDRVAEILGLDLGKCTREKFNKTSEKYDFVTMLKHPLGLDWGAANTHLNNCVKAYKEIGSVGFIALNHVIMPLELRFSSGERSKALYDEIMELSL